MYVKWKCEVCGDVKISNSKRRHEIDMCKCMCSGLDLEEDYARILGSYQFIEEYDYNFFDEIVLCLDKQGHMPLIKIGTKLYIDYKTVTDIREIEDFIAEGLK